MIKQVSNPTTLNLEFPVFLRPSGDLHSQHTFFTGCENLQNVYSLHHAYTIKGNSSLRQVIILGQCDAPMVKFSGLFVA